MTETETICIYFSAAETLLLLWHNEKKGNICRLSPCEPVDESRGSAGRPQSCSHLTNLYEFTFYSEIDFMSSWDRRVESWVSISDGKSVNRKKWGKKRESITSCTLILLENLIIVYAAFLQIFVIRYPRELTLQGCWITMISSHQHKFILKTSIIIILQPVRKWWPHIST